MRAPERWGGRDPEKCDPVPVEMPIGMKRPETLEDIVARLLYEDKMATAQAQEEYETFEEANDFDMPNVDDADDFMLDLSKYELAAMTEEFPDEPTPPVEEAATAAENSSEDGTADQGDASQAPGGQPHQQMTT